MCNVHPTQTIEIIVPISIHKKNIHFMSKFSTIKEKITHFCKEQNDKQPIILKNTRQR